MTRLDKRTGSFIDPFVTRPWIHELTLSSSKRESRQVDYSVTEELCIMCNKLEDIWFTLNEDVYK